MLKRAMLLSTVILLGIQFAQASDRDVNVARTQKAAQVLKEIMDTPGQAIPQDLLARAKRIAIIRSRA